MALIELILGRPGHEIRWLKKGYQLRYGRDLVSEVRDDLSGKVEQSECGLVFLWYSMKRSVWC